MPDLTSVDGFIDKPLLIYGGYVSARSLKGTIVAAVVCNQPSTDEAKAWALASAINMWPEQDGWYNHSASLSEVSQEQIESVADHNRSLKQ